MKLLLQTLVLLAETPWLSRTTPSWQLAGPWLLQSQHAPGEVASQLNASTNAFLESLNEGPLTFGQLLSALRESDEQSLSQFATRLGGSR